jgi:hypothetical protein
VDNKDMKTLLNDLQSNTPRHPDEEIGRHMAEAVLNIYSLKSGKSTHTSLLSFDFKKKEDVDLVAELYENLTIAIQVINRFASVVTRYRLGLPLDELKKAVLSEIKELWKAVRKKALGRNRAKYIYGLNDNEILLLGIEILGERREAFNYIRKEHLERILKHAERKKQLNKPPVITPTQMKRAFTSNLLNEILKDEGIIVRGIQGFLKNY